MCTAQSDLAFTFCLALRTSQKVGQKLYLFNFFNEKCDDPGKDNVLHTGYSNFEVNQKEVAEEDEKEDVGDLEGE